MEHILNISQDWKVGKGCGKRRKKERRHNIISYSHQHAKKNHILVDQFLEPKSSYYLGCVHNIP